MSRKIIGMTFEHRKKLLPDTTTRCETSTYLFVLLHALFFVVVFSPNYFYNTAMMAYHNASASKPPSGLAGEWLQHEIHEILLKLHRNERLSRTDLATGALALSMIRRYNTLLAPDCLQTVQRLLTEINALLAANPEFLPYES
jgi:hypothetical protein